MPANPFDQLDPNKPKQPQDPAQTPGINPGNPLDALGGGGANPPGGGGATGNPLDALGGGGANPPAQTGGLDKTQPMPATPTQPTMPTVPPGGQTLQPQPSGFAIDPNTVWNDMQSQFQTKFGRAMTPQEAQALQQHAGYTGNGVVNQDMIAKATEGIQKYSGDLANPWGPAPPDKTQGPQSTNDLAQQELQKLLTTGNTDAMKLDMNNPAIAAQRANFDRTNTRATGRERMAAAERAAASGSLKSGGFNAGIASAEQAAGDRAANFESQLMTQELAGQRERVMQAMNMAVQSGNQEQARALQEKLSTMDIDLRKRLGTGQLNLGLLQTLMGDQRSKDALGLGYAQLGQQANQGLLNALLGGLG